MRNREQMGELASCQCAFVDKSCTNPATQEDLRCDYCRDNCHYTKNPSSGIIMIRGEGENEWIGKGYVSEVDEGSGNDLA